MFGWHWHEWVDVKREPNEHLSMGDPPWFEVVFRGKLHQRCTKCGAERLSS